MATNYGGLLPRDIQQLIMREQLIMRDLQNAVSPSLATTSSALLLNPQLSSPPTMQQNRYNAGDKVTVRTGKTVWTITDMRVESTWGNPTWYYTLDSPAGRTHQEAEDQLHIVESVSIQNPAEEAVPISTLEEIKVGDRVVINPQGSFPKQGGGGPGVVDRISPDGPLHISVAWERASHNLYAVSDLLKLVPVTTKATVNFDTVVIADEKRQQIIEALEQINQADLIFNQWGFGETIEKGKGVSMLFYGPPGTGKTLMAQAIANKLGKKLKVLAVADIDSNIPGEAERNIRAAFQNGHADVLLFDECDSLIYSRTNVGPIMAAQVNELLSQLERFDGVTIFTTNRLGHLDEAVNRRLALKLEFDLPTHTERIEIWKRMFPKRAPVDSDVDWERLAIVEMAGGYIKNAVLRAARMAAAEKIDDSEKTIRMKHLIRATMLEAEAMVSFTEAIEDEQSHWGRAIGARAAEVNGKRITVRERGGRNG